MDFTSATMKFFLLAIYLILVNCCPVFCQTDKSGMCPHPEDITPCTCSETYGVEVLCVDVQNKEKLVEILDKTADWSFPSFFIQNSTFMYLPTNFVIQKKVRSLRVRDCIMTSLFEGVIPSNNKLQNMVLDNLVLRSGFKWKHFSKIINLQRFMVHRCEIKRIDQSFVDNFPQGLLYFLMFRTKTKTLDDNAFSKLSDLNYIGITYNKITTIKRSMFPPESKLVTINFSFTKLSYLPDDIFTNMPRLTNIKFHYTNIAVLQESVFKNILPQLSHLDFEGNEIECNCEMIWLTRVTKPVHTNVVCQKPRTLKDLSIKDLTSSHFAFCD